jgi:uridine nucleosidase
MANPGEVTLVPLGPLTNLAQAVSMEPRIAGLVKGVVLMGGAANARGNASAVAEANIYGDPEAAKIVFDAPWPVTMVGLDVTRKTVMSPAYMDALCAAGNRFTDFIAQIVPHYLRFYREFEGVDGCYTHDPSAVAYVIDPTLFETRAMYVDVETHSPTNFGLTAADQRMRSGKQPNVNVCIDVDSERLLALYQQRLTDAEDQHP